MPYAEIVQAAAAALRRAWGTPIELTLVDVVVDYAGAAAVLLRARLNDPPHGRPSTVIIKRSNTPEGVEMEWAGLAFLTELADTRTLVPQPLARDATERLLVMTDLADQGLHLVGDLLFAGADSGAEDALNAAQAALGRLNAAGIGQQGRYLEVRTSLGGAQASRHAVNKLDDMLTALPQVFAKHLRRPVSSHVDNEVRAARICLFDPGPFTTITHGDPTVGNLLYSPAHGVKFLDLETAGYRHALLDGSFARLRYLHSVWAHHIPLNTQRLILRSYRTELTKGCPQAGDDLAFGQALVAACAAWLAALCAHLDRVADHDVGWGRASYRQRIATSLDHFISVADEHHHMPALCDAASDLKKHLHNIWPTTELRLATYPALVEG